jgi:hypothetical protein
MSQAGIINMAGGGGGGSPVQTLTGNIGGAVPPTANNINIIGSGSVLVTGTPGTSTLTITIPEVLLTGTATTTGPTNANINVIIPVPNNSTVSVRVNLAGYDSTANLGIGGELLASVKNVSGVLSIIGTSDRTKNSDMPINDATWALITSGLNALVQVTGTANGGGSDVINWRATIDTVTAP